MVPVGGRWQGWFPLTGSPWKPPWWGSYLCRPPSTFLGTSSQAHLVTMSLRFISCKSNLKEKLNHVNWTQGPTFKRPLCFLIHTKSISFASIIKINYHIYLRIMHIFKKKIDAIISTEISLNAQAIYEMISSSNGLFWWSVTVNHGYHPPSTASSPSIYVRTLKVTELRPIFNE